MRTTTLYLLYVLLLSACTFRSEAPPDLNTFHNHRKQVWFVDNKTNEGKWVWIDKEDGTILANGTCTMYYADQVPRMSFELDRNGNARLIDHYNLSGQVVTHQSKLLAKNKVVNVYLQDGAFQAFDSDKNVAFSGTVQDGVLKDWVVHSPYLDLIATNNRKHSAHTIVGVFLKSIVKAVNHVPESGQKRLQPEVLGNLQACHRNTLDTLSQMINNIDTNVAHPPSKEMAHETIAFIKVQKQLLEKDMAKLLKLMEGEFDQQNMQKMHQSVKVFVNRYGYKTREIDTAWNDILFEDVPFSIYEFLLNAKTEAIADAERAFVCGG